MKKIVANKKEVVKVDVTKIGDISITKQVETLIQEKIFIGTVGNSSKVTFTNKNAIADLGPPSIYYKGYTFNNYTLGVHADWKTLTIKRLNFGCQDFKKYELEEAIKQLEGGFRITEKAICLKKGEEFVTESIDEGDKFFVGKNKKVYSKDDYIVKRKKIKYSALTVRESGANFTVEFNHARLISKHYYTNRQANKDKDIAKLLERLKSILNMIEAIETYISIIKKERG